MLFTSNIFLFVFLPFTLFSYYFLCKSLLTKNILLTIVSLLFYAWGEPKNVILILISIVINWTLALIISSLKENSRYRFIVLIITFVFNLSLLFYFKYFIFAFSIFQTIFGYLGTINDILLPIGISFFTFQAMSYVLDVYNGKAKVQKNLFKVALYISFFPQLIAGPIVKYSTIEDQIDGRFITKSSFNYGVIRFLEGFNKKVLLSNVFAVVTDNIFSMDLNNIGMPLAWLAAISYTLQIFFDFSGYSDMAIGLGSMFGFTFLENFNYPYIANSITNFWNRWHISLGSWFKEYIYYPLGGNRTTKLKMIFNLFVVWLFTGVWHGANYTFIIWGLYYFVLLLFEKSFKIDKIKCNYTIIYTLFFVMIGWVIFRSPSLKYGIEMIALMFGYNSVANYNSMQLVQVYIKEYWQFYAIGLILCTPIIKNVVTKTKNENIHIVYNIIQLSLFMISIIFIINGTYNPFIYFNF